jgi:molybdopterin-guanine dinucleotide biosynthesis protein A
MPLLNPLLISHICSLSGNWDVVLPWPDSGPEPLYGVYHKQCIGKIEDHLQQNCYKIRQVLDSLNVRKIGQDEILDLIEDLSTFHNINFDRDLTILTNQSDKVSNG